MKESKEILFPAIKGGSWFNVRQQCSSAYHDSADKRTNAFTYVSFRVVVEKPREIPFRVIRNGSYYRRLISGNGSSYRSQSNPTIGNTAIGFRVGIRREKMTDKLLRGGSWYNNPILCRSAYRYINRRDDYISDVGFRAVVDTPKDANARGGSWYNHPNSCRSASRYINLERALNLNYGGFRVIVEQPRIKSSQIRGNQIIDIDLALSTGIRIKGKLTITTETINTEEN